MNLFIRKEQVSDYKQTEDMIRSAFLHEEISDQSEHHLVARLRQTNAFIPELSLVAVDETEKIIGHVLLSRITINGAESLALAPVSVIPEKQKQGIGNKLIQAALHEALKLGFQSVIVLGHSKYYPKFGFKKASTWNIQAPFDVPDESFMALELTEGALQNIHGIVQYSEAFTE